jgi:hypothetical protein
VLLTPDMGPTTSLSLVYPPTLYRSGPLLKARRAGQGLLNLTAYVRVPGETAGGLLRRERDVYIDRDGGQDDADYQQFFQGFSLLRLDGVAFLEG